MINILTFGFENIFEYTHRYYNYLSNYSDLNITVVVPDYIYKKELIKSKPSENLFNSEQIELNSGCFKRFNFYLYASASKDQIKKIIEKNNPHIIEISSPLCSKYTKDILNVLKGFPEIKKVYSMLEDPDSICLSPNFFIKKKILKQFDFIIIRSELLKNIYKEMKIKIPYKVIPYPVENQKFDKPLNNNEKLKIFLEIDNFYENYSKFFIHVKSIKENIRFSVYGNKKVFNILETNGFEVDFLENISSNEKKINICDSDIYIFLKKYDFHRVTFTHNILRAFLNNRCVILSKKFPYNIIFKDKVWFIENMQPDDFETMLKDIDIRHNHLNNAYNFVENNYSIKNIAPDLFELYKYLYRTIKIG